MLKSPAKVNFVSKALFDGLYAT